MPLPLAALPLAALITACSAQEPAPTQPLPSPDETSAAETSAAETSAAETSAAETSPSSAWPPADFAPALLETEPVSGLSMLRLGRQDDHVVIAVHGLGSRPESFAGLARPWSDRVMVLLPAGPLAWKSDGGSWWPYDQARSGRTAAEVISEAADRLAAFIAAQTEPSDHVVLTGFSQGGILSFAVATRRPELVDLAVPVGGLLPPDIFPSTLPSNAPPVRALHGELDTRVPTDSAKDTVAHMATLGWDATLTVYEGTGHSIDAPMREALAELVTADPQASDRP